MTLEEIVVIVLLVAALVIAVAAIRRADRNRRDLIDITHIMEETNEKAEELIEEIGRAIERMRSL